MTVSSTHRKSTELHSCLHVPDLGTSIHTSCGHLGTLRVKVETHLTGKYTVHAGKYTTHAGKYTVHAGKYTVHAGKYTWCTDSNNDMIGYYIMF